MNFLRWFMLVIIYFTYSCQTSIMAKELKVSHKNQKMNSWCWAAVGAMAYEHVHGKPIKGCQIATTYYDDKVNCCPINEKCNHNLTLVQFEHLLRIKLGFETKFHYRLMTFREVVRAINKNQIIVAGVMGINVGQIGHVVLVTGYLKDEDYLHMLDPNLGTITIPYRMFTMKEKPLGEWKWSIIIKPKKR